MSINRLLVLAVYIAFLAFTLMIVDKLLMTYCAKFLPGANKGGFTWIAFQAWAMYFLAGGKIIGGVRTLLGYAVGIIASAGIMEINKLLESVMPGNATFFALPVAVFIIVIPVIMFEKLSLLLLDFVPAIFVGAGVFFAFMSMGLTLSGEGLLFTLTTDLTSTAASYQTYLNAATTILAYCLLGLIYGWMTVGVRRKIAQEA